MVGEKAVSETTPDELVQLIVGRAALDLFAKAALDCRQDRVTVRDLVSAGAGPVDFDVREGELLGLVGLRGAGQEDDRPRAVRRESRIAAAITLRRRRRPISPARATRHGRRHRPDRPRPDGGIGRRCRLSIRENTFLNPGAIRPRPVRSCSSPTPRSANRPSSSALSSACGRTIRDLPIEALSGGNQQKVVVGRWLATGRKLLVAEDPTAGVDVGAKAEIYRLIARALDAGLAVVVVSTDFEEIAHICHRALVFIARPDRRRARPATA